MFVTIIVVATLLILLGLLYYFGKKEQKEYQLEKQTQLEQNETLVSEIEIEEITVPEPAPKPKPDILDDIDVEYFIRKTALDILKAELPYIPEYYFYCFENNHIDYALETIDSFDFDYSYRKNSADNRMSSIDLNDHDPLFDEAARLIVIHQQGSPSLIQRKFAIGYNRAGHMMDQLEVAGIVGSIQGSKPRNVLITDEYSLEQKLSNLRGYNYNSQFKAVKRRYATNEDEIIEAIELRFFDKIEIEKSVITKEIEWFIVGEKQARIKNEQAELEAIKKKLLEKERKKALAKEAREQLISEGLIAPSKTTRQKKE